MILFSGYTGFAEIAKKLSEQEFNIATIDPQFAQLLSGMEVNARWVGDVLPPEINNTAFQVAVSIIEGVDQSLNGTTDSLHNWAKQELKSYLYPRLPDTIKIIASLDIANPQLVVLHNDVEPLTRVVALWAQARGVPCLHIPHAIYQDINRGGPGTDVHDLITATYLAAAGPFQRKWYEKRGFDPNRIRETGIPSFDRWYKFNIDKQQCRQLLGVPMDRPIVTYCSTWVQTTNIQGYNDEWQVTYQNLLQLAKNTNIYLVVKCHPFAGKENFDWHGHTADQVGVQVTLLKDHLEIALKAADVVCAYASNTILDGAFAGAKLVSVRGYDDDPQVITTDPENVIEGIRQALESPTPDYKPLFEKYTGVTESTHNVVEFITDLVAQKVK